jgi:outer membrane protein, heavy metal efflux system
MRSVYSVPPCRTLSILLFCIFICLPFLPASSVSAQTSLAPADIDSLIEAVLADNAGLQSRRLQVAAREALISSEGALDDPTVSYAIAPNSIGDSIPSNFGNALRVRQNIQLSQALPWPGKRALRSEKMAASAKVAQQSYEITQLQLATQTRLLWAQWWYVNRALNSNLEHQQLTADLNQVAQTRYGNGLGLQQDVLKVETHSIQLRHQHLVLEQEQRRMQAHINQLLNQTANATLPSPVGELALPALPEQPVLEQWLLENHPALKELQAEANVALLNRRLTDKDDYPDMHVNLGYNEMWNESAMRLEVGVSLNIPLDFGKRSARKSAAEFEYHSVQMDITNKRSELLSALEAELSNLDEALHGIHLLEDELLPSAQQTVNAALANYEGGGGNFFELIEANEQLLDTQLLLTKTIADQYMALAELDQLTGGRLWPRGDRQ